MVKIVYTREEKSLIFEKNQRIEQNHTKNQEVVQNYIKKDIYEYVKNINIDAKAFTWFCNIENMKVKDSYLEDFYTYDNIPLYYFERPTIYLNFKQIISCFFIIKNIIESIHDDIEVESDDDIFLDVCNRVFNLKCHKVLGKRIVSSVPQSVKDKKLKMLLRILRGIKSYVKFKFSPSNKDNVLVVSNVMNLNLLKVNNEEKFVDTQIGSVVNKLKEDFNVFNMQCIFNFDMLDKGLLYKEDYVPFEFFMIYKKLKGEKLVHTNLIKNNLSNFENINWIYEGYDLKEVMLKYAFNNLESRYMSDLIEILCAERFIKKHKIKKCILTDEGDRPRCFVTAGNRQNIDTFAIQHGIINEVSPAYIINTKYDNVIPKCSFVWGERYKNMLKNNSNIYNRNKVESVGQLRTDFLMNYLKHKANDNSKVRILYATQYFKDLLMPATDILFDALNLMEKDYEVLVKLHPADQYYDIYKSKAEEKRIKNIKIVKDGDLYEFLAWCDVVVSVHSTVVVEGALLNKPSICIKLPKYNDAGGFIKDGLSIGIENENELKNYLDNIHSYKFDEKFNQYMQNNFYKVDGKVTERITSTMINLTKNQLGGKI
ncbi:hypothetical protein RBU49_02735 [Clostridium sp. MB40-C1]|uniref:capsular polysaccharide export protein, LipB/KpsS family n=1 Tax=Clostridium sp. MB40-C1 TaxID=3070996 RepID=UPI0027DFA23C|nr:hypothetical protein [Clostridium sp. MB40-C1]WMJ81186.1 hypothetical protein RBU49_02735 [Clostridium sp. MB40-C1]